MAMDMEALWAKMLRAFQKGDFDEAIAGCREILRLKPGDVRVLQKLAEIYLRKKDTAACVTIYLVLAMRYSKQGFFLKAARTYKQILDLEQEQTDALEELANLYAQLDLISEAIETYGKLAVVLRKRIKDTASIVKSLRQKARRAERKKFKKFGCKTSPTANKLS